MTPFEISENFRNLKINIMMVKGSVKELSAELEEMRGDSSGQSGESESTQEIESKLSELSEQFSSSESVLSQNSAELQNLSEQFQILKSSCAEVEDLVRASDPDADEDGVGNLESLESSLESLKQELAESESKREENKKVMLSLLDQFNDFKSKQAEVSDDGKQSDDIPQNDVSNSLQSLTERMESLESEVSGKLEEVTEKVSELGNAEEPPPPPPVLAFDGSEEIHELNAKLTSSIDSLEERVSKIQDSLANGDYVSSVPSGGSEKKELDGVDNLVKVDPQSNYTETSEISPQMTMNTDEENQDSVETTEEETSHQNTVESDDNEELTIKKNTRIYNNSRKYKIKLLKKRNET